MSDDDTEPSYELAMPFVTVASKGGPHDDAAYCAGWECGQIDLKLGDIDPLCGEMYTATVHTENLPQLDLIAMKHGFRLAHVTAADPVGIEYPEWSDVQFTPAKEVRP